MRSHIVVHRATTKYFSNSFVFKTEIEKEGLPGDITPALGAGGPEFKSRRPTTYFFVFNTLFLILQRQKLNLGPTWVQVQASPCFRLREVVLPVSRANKSRA